MMYIRLSRQILLKLANLFLSEFQKSGELSKLLEAILFKQEYPHSYLFAFLLQLAGIQDKKLQGN